MKINKRIAISLALSVFISNIGTISFANTTDRYKELTGEHIIIDNSVNGHVELIEMFGNIAQDKNDLENIQSVGKLYTDKNGNPILDSQGRKQYKIDITSGNEYIQPIKDGLVSWVDAKYGKPGDTTWKDMSGNNNDLDLIGFSHDTVDGFNGDVLKLSNKRKLKIESRDYIKVKKDESYSLELFFDGEDVDYLMGLQNGADSTEYGSYICAFGLKNSYKVGYHGYGIDVNGNFNNKNNHAVLIKDGQNDKLKLYLNGNLIYERDITDGDNGNNQKIQIGAHGSNYHYPSSLNIYSHRRYNKALTEAEIKNNYNYELYARQGNKVSILLPTQLQKVGNVTDRLYWDSSKNRYVIEKKVGTITLDGSEYWKYTNQTDNFFRATYDIPGAFGTWEVPCALSDRFVYNEHNAYYTLSESIALDKVGQFYICLAKSRLSEVSLTGFKAWLSKNPVTAYYPYAQAQTIETSISNKIKIPTYSNETHIYTDNVAKPTLKVAVDILPEIAQNNVVKAETTSLINDISIARMYVNMLPDCLYKDQLQARLNDLFPENLTLEHKSVTANADAYIKYESMLSMSLSTNMVTFNDYSGVDELEMLNAVDIIVNSSLPYSLNAYMPTQIYNNDKTRTLDINILNIRENSQSKYQSFANTTDKIVLKDNCETGNDKIHTIDLKLTSNKSYKADIYKTVIKFEAEQK